MSTEEGAVRFVSAALDETPFGEVILRGVLEVESLSLLQVDAYQREILSGASMQDLIKAYDTGQVPDIVLGMRGESFSQPDPNVVLLHDPVYIIDGLQRVSAARAKVAKGDTVPPRVGAMVHLNTQEPWERERFKILNLWRTKLSSNVLLRNWRHDHDAVLALWTLCENGQFVMRGRVCWEQRMHRGELITAVTLAKVIGRLHSHLGPTRSSQVEQLVVGLDRLMSNIGRNIFRGNTRVFFDIIDKAWGIQRVTYREGAVYLRHTFMLALAQMFSEYENFWDGNRLSVDAPTIRKLAQFKTDDPNVARMSGSTGRAADMLTILLAEHVNSGRRTNRLKRRQVDEPASMSDAEESEDEDEDGGDGRNGAAAA